MWSIVLSLILLLTPLTATLENNEVPSTTCGDDSLVNISQTLAHRKPSRDRPVHVIGLFDIHKGDNCHLLRRGGMEQVMLIIGILENQLMAYEANGTDIGFDIFDICSNSSSSLIYLVDALRKVDERKSYSAATSYLGVIGPMNPRIQVDMERFLKTSKMTYFPLELESLRDEIKAISSILLDLKRQSVALFFATKTLEDEFQLEADKRNICITFSVVLTADARLETLLRMKFQEITATGIQVAIVLGSHIELRRLFEISVLSNSSIRYWFMAGLSSKDSMLSILFGPDQPGILFRKPVTSIPNIDQGSVQAYEFSGKTNRPNLVENYVEYINGSISNSSGGDINEIQCQSHHFRAQNPHWRVIEETVTKLLDILRKGGYLSNATEIKNSRSKELLESSRKNVSGAFERFDVTVDLLKAGHRFLVVLMKVINGLYDAYIGWTNNTVFVLAVGFLSAIAIIGLPAVVNAAGFTQTGIEKVSLASTSQSILFGRNISGSGGFFFAGLQGIGQRGFLNWKEKLFVIAVCTAIVLFSKLLKTLLVNAVYIIGPASLFFLYYITFTA